MEASSVDLHKSMLNQKYEDDFELIEHSKFAKRKLSTFSDDEKESVKNYQIYRLEDSPMHENYYDKEARQKEKSDAEAFDFIDTQEIEEKRKNKVQ